MSEECRNDGGTDDFAARIADRIDIFTPAERALASWFTDNSKAMAFHSGSQIAKAVGVSEMTLIRFVRALGYASLRDLKKKLLSAPSPELQALDDVTERFTSRSSDAGQLANSLERELEAVFRAYEAATTERWNTIVIQGLEGARTSMSSAFRPPRASPWTLPAG